MGTVSAIPTCRRLIRLLDSDAGAGCDAGAGNGIATLPEDLGALTWLRHFSVHENQLAALPRALLRLRELRFLRVEDNAGLNLPPELAQHETRAENDASFRSWTCAEGLACQVMPPATRMGMCFVKTR